MTNQPTMVIPEFTMGDRLRKARELTGLGQAQFAAECGISRQAVSNGELGNSRPHRLTLRAWALRTGVPVQWLETGIAPRPEPEGDEECAARDSNPEPSDYAVLSMIRPSAA